MMQVEQVMDDVSRGCIHKKSTLTIVKAKKKFHMVFPKIGVQGPKRRQNSPRRVQTLSSPCQFSLNAIVIEINPLDIKCMTFLHVVHNSSITVVRGCHPQQQDSRPLPKTLT